MVQMIVEQKFMLHCVYFYCMPCTVRYSPVCDSDLDLHVTDDISNDELKPLNEKFYLLLDVISQVFK